mmetsp:Transcript_4137/g.6308  ORF Transcript_4137/g.6308 Transcript_4137/m.6308 type:complete len:191 (-) Transcript_4137:26-598(-)
MHLGGQADPHPDLREAVREPEGLPGQPGQHPTKQQPAPDPLAKCEHERQQQRAQQREARMRQCQCQLQCECEHQYLACLHERELERLREVERANACNQQPGGDPEDDPDGDDDEDPQGNGAGGDPASGGNSAGGNPARGGAGAGCDNSDDSDGSGNDDDPEPEPDGFFMQRDVPVPNGIDFVLNNTHYLS